MKYYEARKLARLLRNGQTEAEKIIWQRVRNRLFLKLKFSRQYLVKYILLDSTVNYFIADFYCHAYNLIVEIDGPIHNQRKEYDRERTEILVSSGFRILRLKNELIIADVEKAMAMLKFKIDSLRED